MGRHLSVSEGPVMRVASVPTQKGVFTAWFSPVGLQRLYFPGTAPALPPRAMELAAGHAEAARVGRALDCLLAGKKPRWQPRLDLGGATAFQRAVWEALLAIPVGQTRSYAEIAAAVGRPRAARAIGQACGANPVPVFIPCHRVRASDGGLGGFSSGLDWKRQLLEAEGSLPLKASGRRGGKPPAVP